MPAVNHGNSVLVMGAMLLKQVPQISAYFQSRQAKAPFPVTGAVRWFIPASANGVNDAAPLTITGFAEACRHDPIRKKAAWGAVST